MQRRQSIPDNGAAAGQAKPNFFIVGAPKCGTTSLHEYLQRHPDVFMPFYKEPHFFGSDLEGSRFRQFRDQPERYLKLFRDARGEKRIGESSPWYLSSRRAAEEIHAYDPQAKIIIMLRNPVDMMYSMWSQFRYSGNEQIETFEAALDAEPERRRGERIRRAAHCVSGLYYRDMACFSDQVGRYFDLFGRENVKVIIFDDFKSDTAAVYRDVLEFLDIDAGFQTTFDIVNPNKEVRLEWLQKLIVSSGFSLMLLKDRLTYLATTHSLVPMSYRTRAVKGVIAVYTKYERRSPLTPGLRTRLSREFQSDIDKLSGMLGRDLSHWYKDLAASDAPANEEELRIRPAAKTGKRSQVAWRLLSIVITVALLYFVVNELGGADLAALISRIPTWSWAGALLVYLTLNLLRALRFRVLLDKRESPMRLLIPITLYHNGLVRVVPFKLGEISYVILLKTRLNYTMQEGVGSLFGARILELLIIVLVFVFGIFMSGEQFAAQRDQLMAGALSVFLASVIGLYYAGSLLRLALGFMQRMPVVAPVVGKDRPDSFFALAQSKLTDLAAEFDRIRQPRLFFSALFISCFTYTSSFLTNYILLRAVGLDADLPIVITVISLGMFGSAFPFTLSGFGIVETAWWTGLTRFAGYAGDEAAAIGIVLHGFQIVAAVLYGLAGYVLIRLSPPLPLRPAQSSEIKPDGDSL
ncbi:MAG: lysylphosphatidylglycerol synthase domain-containing protein [Chloroflexota bacterium]|nr:lysylphosphatidylglycerol synthase domain-containing protein [Chloroflexota bacterium]